MERRRKEMEEYEKEEISREWLLPLNSWSFASRCKRRDREEAKQKESK